MSSIYYSKENFFPIELAQTSQEREQGLQNRILEPGSGMLFVFEDLQESAFHTFNCLHTLDFVFMNENFEIVEIISNVEPDFPAIFCETPYQYCLELRGGESKSLTPGMKAQLQ